MWNAKQHSYEELRDVVMDVLHQRIAGNNQYETLVENVARVINQRENPGINLGTGMAYRRQLARFLELAPIGSKRCLTPRSYPDSPEFRVLAGHKKWYTAVVTNLGRLLRKALFYGIFRASAAAGRESLPLRHLKMASRKPRKIRPFCTTGVAGVAPGCSPEGSSFFA
jgi:hypothetical protein